MVPIHWSIIVSKAKIDSTLTKTSYYPVGIFSPQTLHHHPQGPHTYCAIFNYYAKCHGAALRKEFRKHMYPKWLPPVMPVFLTEWCGFSSFFFAQYGF